MVDHTAPEAFAEPHLTHVLGIDVHSKKHTAALGSLELLNAHRWAAIPTLELENTAASYAQLDELVDEAGAIPAATLAILDRTGTHYSAPLAYHLARRGHPITYAEPTQVNGLRKVWKARKTDALDAQLFAAMAADQLRAGAIRFARPNPDLEGRAAALRSLLATHRQTTRASTQLLNRLHQLAIRTWPEMEAKHFEAWLSVAIAIPTPAHLETPLLVDRAPRKDTLAKLRRLPASIGDPDPHVAQAIVTAARALQATQATAAQVLQEVEQQIGDHPYGPILMSFPAIGAKTAAEIAANLVDVHRFTVTKHPAKATRKLLGYGAETTKTGNSTSTKPGRGSRRSKSLLFLAVLNCLSNGTQPYASLYRRHKRSKTHFQAMYATAGKLAEHIFAALSSGQPFKPPPTPAPTDEPDTRIDQPAETPIDNSDT